MYTRTLFQTKDMQAQHDLLSQVAALVDAGEIQTTLSQAMGRINATNLIAAHQLIESGRSMGKVVLNGFN
jgi:NADPH:quinone reductase-like Zn-dependent oxidoreductase